MTTKFITRRRSLIMILILLLTLMAFAIPAAQSQDATTLLIGFYGPDDSSAVAGLRVAIEEMQDFGPITGGDGQMYQIEVLGTQDISQLNNAIAVIVVPESPEPATSITFNMPVFMLSPDASLELPNIDATVFRGLTDEAKLSPSHVDQLAAMWRDSFGIKPQPFKPDSPFEDVDL